MEMSLIYTIIGFGLAGWSVIGNDSIQTLGTFIYTLFKGKLEGKDEFGNKYYSNKQGKRWVVYQSRVESSKHK